MNHHQPTSESPNSHKSDTINSQTHISLISMSMIIVVFIALIHWTFSHGKNQKIQIIQDYNLSHRARLKSLNRFVISLCIFDKICDYALLFAFRNRIKSATTNPKHNGIDAMDQVTTTSNDFKVVRRLIFEW